MRRHAKIFLAATAVALLLRLFLLEDYRIVSGSMSPTLMPGDLVFVSKFDFNLRLPFSTYELFRVRTPQRGEIVAFTLPDRGRQMIVKRVVALEGDRVAVRDYRLVVNDIEAKYGADANGHPIEIAPDGASYPVGLVKEPQRDFGPVEVPPGHFFALGDYRSGSVDSRVWGPVPFSSLKGKVRFVWLSIDSEGRMRGERFGLRPNAYALELPRPSR